ncbi:MAG: thioredoxin family protein [Bdellovibrionales bacterium]|nr:thioredoxin family protein [Bdellovibrionales bacterium]
MKFLSALLVLVFTNCLMAEVEVGKPAPSFNEVDQNGKSHQLSDFKGKWVVLEWFNEGCPYVKKHYGSKNMQMLQDKYTKKGVQWLTVATSAEGKQGYVAPGKANDQMKRVNMKSTALLLDADGTMGRAFDAKTTPHMFVIDPQGTVVYAGAIDSNDSSNPSTISKAENYVVAALDSAMAGKEVQKSSTQPYGCSVKYK